MYETDVRVFQRIEFSMKHVEYRRLSSARESSRSGGR